MLILFPRLVPLFFYDLGIVDFIHLVLVNFPSASSVVTTEDAEKHI